MKLNNSLYGKIELKKLNGVIYYDKDNTDCECWNLYDEEKNFIDTFYGSNIEMLEFAEKIENITNIYDLVDLGLSINMMYATDKEELEDMFVEYDFENSEEDYQKYIETHTTEEYKKLLEKYDLPINRLGQYYFIVNYTEI